MSHPAWEWTTTADLKRLLKAARALMLKRGLCGRMTGPNRDEVCARPAGHRSPHGRLPR